ncbi:MAG: hypothetical protein K8W52_12380, partial [Deltaproteobacteria bacterium]|nr:hypothetical protein [Deltaproteobacteria bacterium]
MSFASAAIAACFSTSVCAWYAFAREVASVFCLSSSALPAATTFCTLASGSDTGAFAGSALPGAGAAAPLAAGAAATGATGAAAAGAPPLPPSAA